MRQRLSFSDAMSAVLWATGIMLSESPRMAAMILLAVATHEAGHICACAVLGEPVPRLRPGLFGLRLDPMRTMGYKKEFITALSGPAANLLCALIMTLTSGMSDAVAVNIILALCNLLPVCTLDGGRMLECFAAKRMGAGSAYALCRAVSFSVLSAVAMVSLVVFWLTAGGGFLFVQAFCAMIIHISSGQSRHERRE